LGGLLSRWRWRAREFQKHHATPHKTKQNKKPTTENIRLPSHNLPIITFLAGNRQPQTSAGFQCAPKKRHAI
jgi:hypothetical protein